MNYPSKCNAVWRNRCFNWYRALMLLNRTNLYSLLDLRTWKCYKLTQSYNVATKIIKHFDPNKLIETIWSKKFWYPLIWSKPFDPKLVIKTNWWKYFLFKQFSPRKLIQKFEPIYLIQLIDPNILAQNN